MSAGNVEQEGSLIRSQYVEPAKERLERSLAVARRGSTRVLVKSPSEEGDKDESVLRDRYNMVCNAGHHWFSTTPEEWYGSTCEHPKAGHRCILPLHPLSPDGKTLPIPRNAKWRIDG